MTLYLKKWAEEEELKAFVEPFISHRIGA